MKTLLPIILSLIGLSAFAQTSSRPLRFYESIAAMVANRPLTNEVLAVTQRSGTNAGPLLFFWHAPTAAATNTVDTFNAVGGGQFRLITNVVTVAISDGTITTNKWDSVAHQWVSGKQDYSPILSGLINLSFVTGDLLYWNGSAFARVPLGTNGQALTVGTNAVYYATPSSGGSGNANTNASTAWADSTSVSFYDLDIRGSANIANLIIGSASYSGVWSFPNGGHGATNASQARTNLGLIPDVDVQAFRLPLLQFYVAMAADGDMPYRNSSGIITNATSTSAGRALLTAVNAAAQRSSMGVPSLAGDTFTGPVIVPTDAYNASTWTNGSKTNEVPTKRAIAEKIEALSVGGYIASVASDFQVAASQLSVTNTVGSGRIVRESATGATASMSGLSDVALSSTNNLHKGDYFSWGGSNWVQTLSPMGWASPDQWEEIWWNIQGTFTGSGFTQNSISSGTQSGNANLLHGRVGYLSLRAPTSTTTFWGGAYCVMGSTAALGNANFAPTNEFYPRFEVLVPTTNGVIQNIGLHDGLDSTNAPTDALYVTVTNGVARFVASMAGSTSVGSSTYIWATNQWHQIRISATNQIAVVTITTNGVVAFQDSINSANVPGGGTVLTGLGANAFTTGAGVSTNGENLLILKRIGIRWSTH